MHSPLVFCVLVCAFSMCLSEAWVETKYYYHQSPKDACNQSPCGINAQCRDGVCTCAYGYHGDPYIACQPGCVSDVDCPAEEACAGNKCKNPCPGKCAPTANCNVKNHIPICTCPHGTTGNAFDECHSSTVQLGSRRGLRSRPGAAPDAAPAPMDPIYEEIDELYVSPYAVSAPDQSPKDACNPSPCGINAQCRDGVCTCFYGYHGDPYIRCQSGCVSDVDCPAEEACAGNKCKNPCPGKCDLTANCNVKNHNPICTCPHGTTGNAYKECTVLQLDYIWIWMVFGIVVLLACVGVSTVMFCKVGSRRGLRSRPGVAPDAAPAPMDPIYEEIDELYVSPYAVSAPVLPPRNEPPGDISDRAPQPLPEGPPGGSGDSEENYGKYEYVHYDTPYDWRIYRLGVKSPRERCADIDKMRNGGLPSNCHAPRRAWQ